MEDVERLFVACRFTEASEAARKILREQDREEEVGGSHHHSKLH